MANADPADRRVKFYGLNDLGTYSQVEHAAKILEHYDPSSTARTVSDVLELYNTQLFAENSVFPNSYTDKQREACKALIPELRKTVGKFFATMNDANIASILVNVDYQYYADLLELLARHKVYDHCAATTLLPALEQTNIDVGAMLTSERLVQRYDGDVRARLVADPRNAVHLIRKYLEQGVHHSIYLPSSLTETDKRALLDSYLDSDDPNPNLVRLIATAQLLPKTGIDAKLKLKAKRKHGAWTKDFFKKNTGMKSGSVVSISDTQTEPVVVSHDGLVAKYAYSHTGLRTT